MEEWKPITKPYPIEGYKISSYGRIKSYKSREPRLLNCHPNTGGYLKTKLSKGSIGNIYYGSVHRLVALNFVPFTRYDNEKWWQDMPKQIQKLFFESAFQVNHIDGDKTNNHKDNLEWSTPKENTKHWYDNHFDANAHKEKMKKVGQEAKETGRFKGSNNPRALDKHEIEFESGEKIVVDNLTRWCRESQGYDWRNVHHVKNGGYYSHVRGKWKSIYKHKDIIGVKQLGKEVKDVSQESNV